MSKPIRSEVLSVKAIAEADYDGQKIRVIKTKDEDIYINKNDVGDAIGLSRPGFVNFLKRSFDRTLTKEIVVPYICGNRHQLVSSGFLKLSDALIAIKARSAMQNNIMNKGKAKDFYEWIKAQDFNQAIDCSENNVLEKYSEQVVRNQKESKMEFITIKKTQVISDIDSCDKKLITAFLGSDGFIYFHRYELARAMGIDKNTLYARTRKFGFLDFWVKMDDSTYKVYCKKDDTLALLRELGLVAKEKNKGKTYYGLKQSRKLLKKLESIDFDALFGQQIGSDSDNKKDDIINNQAATDHASQKLESVSIVAIAEPKNIAKEINQSWGGLGSKVAERKINKLKEDLVKNLFKCQIDTRFLKLNITIL